VEAASWPASGLRLLSLLFLLQELPHMPQTTQDKKPVANTVTHESPFPNLPGSITVPKSVSAADYLKWYKALPSEGAADDENAPYAFSAFERQKHIVKHCSLEGVNLADLDTVPYAVVLWVAQITNNLIKEAQSPNELLGSSANTTAT
jgi:hypothetical protein